jgi:uncharacterized protein (TIGR03000 family)
MLRKLYSTFGALEVATTALLLTPGASLAQHHGGGGHGGGGHGGGHGGASHGGASHGGAVHGGGFHDGHFHGGSSAFFFGVPFGGYWPNYYSWGYPRYYYGPSYYDTYDYGEPSYYSYDVPYTTDYQSFYPSTDTAADQKVRATVLLPTADAQLWVEGQPMTSTGTTRQFVSPSLESGQRFVYTFQARWTENGRTMEQTRRPSVHAGDQITVDFTRAEQ